MSAKQDAAEKALTRHLRSAQNAQDKIGHLDIDSVDKMLALTRIEQYGGVVMSRVLEAEKASQQHEEADHGA